MKLYKNLSNKTPLCLAAEFGDPEIVKSLLSREEIDVNLTSIRFCFIYSISS